MRRRRFVMLLGAAALSPLAARAQQPAKVPTVGFLGAESAATNRHFLDAFRQGMREHGHVDGKSVAIVERWADGRSERFPELIGELLRLQINVILAVSAPAALAAKNATAMAKEVIIAAISLHAVTRHQNQRRRYRSPVPAPMDISSVKLSCAVSST